MNSHKIFWWKFLLHWCSRKSNGKLNLWCSWHESFHIITSSSTLCHHNGKYFRVLWSFFCSEYKNWNRHSICTCVFVQKISTGKFIAYIWWKCTVAGGAEAIFIMKINENFNFLSFLLLHPHKTFCFSNYPCVRQFHIIEMCK